MRRRMGPEAKRGQGGSCHAHCTTRRNRSRSQRHGVSVNRTRPDDCDLSQLTLCYRITRQCRLAFSSRSTHFAATGGLLSGKHPATSTSDSRRMRKIRTAACGSALLGAHAAIVVAAAKAINWQGAEMGRRDRSGEAAFLTGGGRGSTTNGKNCGRSRPFCRRLRTMRSRLAPMPLRSTR